MSKHRRVSPDVMMAVWLLFAFMLGMAAGAIAVRLNS